MDQKMSIQCVYIYYYNTIRFQPLRLISRKYKDISPELVPSKHSIHLFMSYCYTISLPFLQWMEDGACGAVGVSAPALPGTPDGSSIACGTAPTRGPRMVGKTARAHGLS